MQPVSIIATELNEIGDIARVVESLLAQEPLAAEIVIVDGGSTDGTWEWLTEEASREPRLRAIRDESCSLKHSKGPVSRGRNVAIAAAKSSIIACADAGCTYAPDWLGNLTARIAAGQAEYALGGACLDPDRHTIWDVASAPFFSIRLSPFEPTRSCTARSMAFTKELWQRIGGFPEQVLVGEDTLFDLEARRQTKPNFVVNAKALYGPLNNFRAVCRQMKRYAISDGQAGVRWARLLRNSARCILQVAALMAVRWTLLPALFVFLLETWYAFHRDWRLLKRFGLRAVLARFVFSVMVPWLVAVNQIRGRFSPKPLTNWQNQGQGTAT
jgi:glycosyltransferase involved in cell wall biosynthesis